MINLYDEEIVQVGQISHQLQQKFGRRTWSSRNGLLRLMEELESEAVARFAEIGLIVKVDTSPMLANLAPTISIDSRIDNADFDHEKKGWEVRQARAKGQTIHGEDKRPE